MRRRSNPRDDGAAQERAYIPAEPVEEGLPEPHGASLPSPLPGPEREREEAGPAPVAAKKAEGIELGGAATG
jgi:hypothetical protein